MNRVRREQGQTLVLALIITVVMMILGFVFVALIGRNFLQTQRFGEIVDVNYYAEAGINFAVRQLVYSEDGADWRPVPANLPDTADNRLDPDWEYLKEFDATTNTGGFTRVTFAEGRALIRVTYNPQVRQGEVTPGAPELDLPGSRYIRIESVGRVGQVDRSDPTVFAAGNRQPRRELVAYVQIGLTDYARWVTNLSRRTTPVELGIPEALGAAYIDQSGQPVEVRVPQILGYNGPDAARRFGAPVRVNGDLTLFGNMVLNVNRTHGDGLFVAGRIQREGGTQEVRRVDGAGVFQINPTGPSFNTLEGVVRDGDSSNDANGYPRGVVRLEPPLVDQVDPTSGQHRYRQMTRNSGIRVNGNNSGRWGYGNGVYVDNFGDVQRDSNNLFGGYSRRSDWLRTDANEQAVGQSSGYWNGPFYEPPGAYLEFFYNDAPNVPADKRAGFVITRNARSPRDTWRLPDGTVTNQHTMVYWFRDDQPYANDPTVRQRSRALYNEATETRNDALGNLAFNGVLYFEGNVRVRGRIPKDRQFTVVSGGTIYIEGNLVKYAERGRERQARAAVALLAREYVVLNTTQFFKPGFENTPRWVKENPTDPHETPHARITSDPLTNVPVRFSFGDPRDAENPLFLFVSHTGTGQGTYTNLLVNDLPYLFPTPERLAYLVGNQPFSPTLPLDATYDLFPAFQKMAVPLWPHPVPNTGPFPRYSLIPDPVLSGFVATGVDNLLQFRIDPNISAPGGKQPYFLSRVAVGPLTIRIDALMYAQNGSFFVIPGPWFNDNRQDRKDLLFAESGGGNAPLWRRQNRNVVTFPSSADYPYHGEPLPIRIVLNGAISENFPPAMSDQAVWLRQWGWMPTALGISSIRVPDHFYPDDIDGFRTGDNPRYIPNMRLTYDPIFAHGRADGGTPASEPIRTDDFGRLLPAVPRLPVCPDVVYKGDARL